MAMSTWVLCGIGIDTARGLWAGGGGIGGAPTLSPSRRDRGAAIASSIRVRSKSPVTAMMSPSGPTWDAWNATMSDRRMRRIRSAFPFGSRPYGWSFGNTLRASSRIARLRVSSARSEEHTSELQSHVNLVCRLLLEKKKKQNSKASKKNKKKIHKKKT